MPESLSKWLAARWYPDIPEANRWRDFGQDNFRDFWRNKDIAQNDTGYMMGPLIMLTCIIATRFWVMIVTITIQI